MPPDAVYVGRPTRWGNPYHMANYSGMLDALLIDFEAWLDDELAAGRLDLEELRGKDLACWCRLGGPCHADVLLRRANP